MAPSVIDSSANLTAEHEIKPVSSAIHPDFIDRSDADFLEYYNKHIAPRPVTHGVTIKQMRENPEKYTSEWARDYSGEPFVKDIELTADDGHVFTARIYNPDEKTSPFGSGPYPIYINFHGGGWTFGGLTSDAEICMAIRNRLGIMVMDVDYRLAPENAFGKGAEDAWAAIRWVHKSGSTINARGDSIAIGGISAGAHISATMQQLARDAGIPLKLAVLGVPAVIYEGDWEKASDSPYASMIENEFAPCLNWKRMDYFRHHYMPKNAAEKAAFDALPMCYRSPLYGKLEGVCDTFLCTAGLDPLRDEGEAYG
ncbi:Alpha/Beta hydrolase protein [Hypoxylon rubiginosum]|uniref:Alpha/Beta hydrolase protein n=1 Tax=Hypoxylon rubiginosum TaxID=110542 RepID=A0ACC0CMC9_9PEZI|nr:Alpha/Beta hydrolase protein [Hypoxylon rubiginosum]